MEMKGNGIKLPKKWGKVEHFEKNLKKKFVFWPLWTVVSGLSYIVFKYIFKKNNFDFFIAIYSLRLRASPVVTLSPTNIAGLPQSREFKLHSGKAGK